MRKHILDDDDEEILRRWKGNGWKVWTEPRQDEERVVVFSARDLHLEVEAGMYGVPIFTQPERELLLMAMDEFEKEPLVVRR